MIKEIYTDDEADEIMNRLQEGLASNGQNIMEIMQEAGYLFGLNIMNMSEEFANKVMENALMVRNDKDEIFMTVPLVNLSEICKKYIQKD